MIAHPQSLIAILGTLVSIPLWAPVLLICTLFNNSELSTQVIRMWMNFVLWIARVKVEVEGREHYDPQKPCLLVSNHQSHLDIPVLFHVLSGNIRMVAKKELFAIPVFGFCMKVSGFIPVSRGNSNAGNNVSQVMKSKILSGLQIWVAPEGTRSADGHVGPFKKGSFAVATEARVPIQPIAIIDAFKALPKSSIMVRPGRVIRVAILAPIPTLGKTTDDRAELAQITQNAIGEVVHARLSQS